MENKPNHEEQSIETTNYPLTIKECVVIAITEFIAIYYAMFLAVFVMCEA